MTAPSEKESSVWGHTPEEWNLINPVLKAPKVIVDTGKGTVTITFGNEEPFITRHLPETWEKLRITIRGQVYEVFAPLYERSYPSLLSPPPRSESPRKRR